MNKTQGKWLRGIWPEYSANPDARISDPGDARAAILIWQRDCGALAPYGLGIGCVGDSDDAEDGCSTPAVLIEQGAPLCSGCYEHSFE